MSLVPKHDPNIPKDIDKKIKAFEKEYKFKMNPIRKILIEFFGSYENEPEFTKCEEVLIKWYKGNVEKLIPAGMCVEITNESIKNNDLLSSAYKIGQQELDVQLQEFKRKHFAEFEGE